MFSSTKKTDAVAMLEAANVQIFLRNSAEFKKMKEIAEKPDMNRYRAFLDRLEKCVSFSDLIHECSFSYDIANHEDVVIQTIGRNGINAICFVSGFVSDAWNYQYYGLHFYESILTYREEKKRSNSLNTP